ncbi:MAG: malectin domain-containing carbohydrate-binding protein [Terracidiphilus sp.]
MATDFNAREGEHKELDWLLTSGVLGRSHNLAQMLKFICEKHFEGQDSQITEHVLAVEALGRRSDFNPQVDTIVRVTAHQLRKRLQEIYAGPGASRSVQIHIPAGQYAPSFIYKKEDTAKLSSSGAESTIQDSSSAEDSIVRPSTARRKWLISGLALAFFVVLGGILLDVIYTRAHSAMGAVPDLKASTVVKGHPVRALLGKGREPYIDRAGNNWMPGNYCTSGANLSEPSQRIAGTEDPTIFLGGLRGHAHCVFPVDPGIYEVHLLFAENSDLAEATNRSVFSLNGGENISLDVVDDAGGDYIADTKVFRGVRPENDGSIHIDFVGEISAMKAVEILPAPSEALLPIRIVAGSKPFKDPEGNIWLPDRYVIGGRPGQSAKGQKVEQTGLYSSHRVGNFRYILPVVPLEKYRVRLYFQEPWFGKENAGIGGPGSRVFDVWCNGVTLLKNFDILSEAGSKPVVKTFDNIQATAQGKIELLFSPNINYPLVNAIEVLPEPGK